MSAPSGIPSLVWYLIFLIIVVIVIVVLLKLVFAIIAIGPIAVVENPQQMLLESLIIR